MAEDDLEKRLLQCRVSLEDIDLYRIKPDNPFLISDVQASIAERLVYEWLQHCKVSFDKDFPRGSNGTTWTMNNRGIYVRKQGKIMHEYDSIVSFNGKTYLIEIKSFKLNGYPKKIPRAFEYAHQMYEGDIRMLIFFPHYNNRKKDAKRIVDEFPDVSVIDTHYKRANLNKAVLEYYRLTGYCIAGLKKRVKR
ncbi:hypothetical protein JXB31_02840 [Candidatus Woesearchaeota archaeon]|nr:hypothetical protein [Candidatus Woesearchaeota archaeon]